MSTRTPAGLLMSCLVIASTSMFSSRLRVRRAFVWALRAPKCRGVCGGAATCAFFRRLLSCGRLKRGSFRTASAMYPGYIAHGVPVLLRRRKLSGVVTEGVGLGEHRNRQASTTCRRCGFPGPRGRALPAPLGLLSRCSFAGPPMSDWALISQSRNRVRLEGYPRTRRVAD